MTTKQIDCLAWIKLSEKISKIAQLESVNLISLPTGGRGYIINLIQRDYQKNTKDTKSIIINLEVCHNQESIEVFTNKIKSLLKDTFINLNKDIQLETLVRNILNKGSRLLIILDHFERIKDPTEITSFLEALRGIDHLNIRFIIGRQVTALSKQRRTSTGSLLLNLNQIYVPCLDRKQTFDLITIFKSYFNWRISEKYNSQIFLLSGGNPGLIKYILKYLKLYKNLDINKLLKNPEVEFKLESINKAIRNLSINDYPFLKQFKSKLFDFYLKSSIKPKLEIETQLSAQEYKLYKLFKKHSDKIVTLDQISKCLWGEHADTKYSQWAIYKTLSNLKKELVPHRIIIKNIKTRGYKLINI